MQLLCVRIRFPFLLGWFPALGFSASTEPFPPGKIQQLLPSIANPFPPLASSHTSAWFTFNSCYSIRGGTPLRENEWQPPSFHVLRRRQRGRVVLSFSHRPVFGDDRSQFCPESWLDSVLFVLFMSVSFVFQYLSLRPFCDMSPNRLNYIKLLRSF